MTSTTGYLAIARTPGVPRGLLAGFTSRLSGGIVPFATIVACSQAYGGFVTSGIASAAFMLAGALLAPTRGRLVDRHGWPALAAGAACHALFLTLAALTIGRFPAWAVLPLLAAGGAISAPVTSSVRTLWSRLVADKQSLQQAHALDSILEEITFVITPLITIAATTVLPARACIALGSWCPLIGVALLYKRITRTTKASPSASSDTDTPSRRRARGRRSLILTREGQGVITPLIVLGLVGGSLNVLLPATAARHGHITSAGYLFALFSPRGSNSPARTGPGNPRRTPGHPPRRSAPDPHVRHRIPPGRRTPLPPADRSQRLARLRIRPRLRHRSRRMRMAPHPHHPTPHHPRPRTRRRPRRHLRPPAHTLAHDGDHHDSAERDRRRLDVCPGAGTLHPARQIGRAHV